MFGVEWTVKYDHMITHEIGLRLQWKGILYLESIISVTDIGRRVKYSALSGFSLFQIIWKMSADIWANVFWFNS